jgi:diguanylate cyclase (GGDEF)-like protein
MAPPSTEDASEGVSSPARGVAVGSPTVSPAAAAGRRLLPLTAALALGAGAVWLFRLAPARQIHPFSPWLMFPVLVALYVVAESAQLHFEVRRQTYSFSLSEFPLVVGLFFTSAPLLLGSRLLAYGLVALYRRMSVAKGSFNLALFAFEVSASVGIIQVFQLRGPGSSWAWAGAFAAVLAPVVVGALMVALSIRVLRQPVGRQDLLLFTVPTVLTAAFTTTIGLLAVTLATDHGFSVVGIVVVAAVTVVTYRRYASLVSEHKSLAELYELTREVASAVRPSGLDEGVLERVRRLMRAEGAQLWLAEDERLISKLADRHSLRTHSPLDPVRRRVMAGDSVLAGPRTDDPELRAALRGRNIRELVAVPLRVGGDVAGSLEVLDRQGERSRFVASDRALLESLAVHTGVALENARLVGRLRHEAYHDQLTALPNSRAFRERLDTTLADTPAGRVLAVFVMDLQSFKDVNDALGREAGDQLLVELAHRLSVEADDPLSVARLSSDELGVFLPVDDLEDARASAHRLQRLLSAPVLLGEVEVEVGAVVGIAAYPDHGGDASTLVQRADMAMYAAKSTSRGILAYSVSLEAPSVRRFGLVTELRRALEARDLTIWYQPQVDLVRSELVGVEALVRWQHPEHGFIPPDEFIPVAEHTGLIGPLTTFVLGQALADLRGWRDDGHEFSVSVNISVRSLLDPGFADEIQQAVTAAGVPPRWLTIEITESGVMSEPDRAVPVLERLRDFGVRLSVDDFGIGQSSLTYLRRLPVGEVKIDRSFIQSMVTNPEDAAIVRAVIDLSEPLGLTVVAEGVESEETRRELAHLGCGVIQGYLLTRPLPKEELERWLQRRTVADLSDPGRRTPRLRVVSR